jgi:cobalt-zinc-cadmium efflux system outer membrane protein
MFGISLPIPILNANRAGIAEARAKREVARAKAETTFADLDRRLEPAIEAHALALEQRDAFMDRIVPLLNDQMHDLRRIAELGEIDLFVMLETTTRQLEARSRLLALQLAALEAATTAAKLLGPDHAVPPALVIVEGVSEETRSPTKPPRGGE